MAASFTMSAQYARPPAFRGHSGETPNSLLSSIRRIGGRVPPPVPPPGGGSGVASASFWHLEDQLAQALATNDSTSLQASHLLCRQP